MGILQARIMEWVAMPFRRSSQPIIEPTYPAMQANSLSSEHSGKPKNIQVGSLSHLQGILNFQGSPISLFLEYIYSWSYSGYQPWIFIRRTDAEGEAPILWPPDVKSQLIGKDTDAGKFWGQGEKGATEDEVVWWHHWLSGHEFEQTQRDSKGQGSLACCCSLNCKYLDTT